MEFFATMSFLSTTDIAGSYIYIASWNSLYTVSLYAVSLCIEVTVTTLLSRPLAVGEKQKTTHVPLGLRQFTWTARKSGSCLHHAHSPIRLRVARGPPDPVAADADNPRLAGRRSEVLCMALHASRVVGPGAVRDLVCQQTSSLAKAALTHSRTASGQYLRRAFR